MAGEFVLLLALSQSPQSITALDRLAWIFPDLAPIVSPREGFAWGADQSNSARVGELRVQPLAVPNWIAVVRRHIAELLALTDEWSSYGERPSEECGAVANAVIDRLGGVGSRPAQVVPMADGGISMHFHAEERTARIEVTNDGEVVLVLQASPESEPEYLDTNPASAATTLGSFLS
jgi:hypothetical protein